MSVVRINPLEPPYPAELEQAFQRIMPPGMAPLKLFRTQAHNPRVLQRMFAGNLLDPGSLSLRERELIILRACACCGSEYEWGVHVALFASRASLSEADIIATLAESSVPSGLAVNELVLIRAVDELHETSTISDELWAGLGLHYSQAQVLEIIALVGNYHSVSFTTNALKMELEDFAPRFAQYCQHDVVVGLSRSEEG